MKPIRHLLLLAVLCASLPAFAQSFRVYHETWCPTVDPLRMTRIKRVAALEGNHIPAADCHRDGAVRYLGQLPFGEGQPEPATDQKTVHVDAYEKEDGTKVREHWRSAPRP